MAKAKQSDSDRQITGITITAKGKVKISFVQITEIEPAEGEEASTTSVNEYSITSPNRPHKDFLDALKKLRKDAFAIAELNIDSKAQGAYTISSIRISGDIVLRQSRVVMTLAKEIKSTGKILKIGPLPQITMYGESEYPKAEEMSKLIEAAIEEAWLYLGGKSEGETQLALFPMVQLETA